MSCAERNRAIKKLVAQAFAPHAVSVKGSRGTAYGWVSIKIDFAPRNVREAGELRQQVYALLDAAKIDVGTYGYNDPGSDYGYGRKMHIDFASPREKADSFGPDAWRQHLSAEDWDKLQQQENA